MTTPKKSASTKLVKQIQVKGNKKNDQIWTGRYPDDFMDETTIRTKYKTEDKILKLQKDVNTKLLNSGKNFSCDACDYINKNKSVVVKHIQRITTVKTYKRKMPNYKELNIKIHQNATVITNEIDADFAAAMSRMVNLCFKIVGEMRGTATALRTNPSITKSEELQKTPEHKQQRNKRKREKYKIQNQTTNESCERKYEELVEIAIEDINNKGIREKGKSIKFKIKQQMNHVKENMKNWSKLQLKT
eukprot:275664_1